MLMRRLRHDVSVLGSSVLDSAHVAVNAGVFARKAVEVLVQLVFGVVVQYGLKAVMFITALFYLLANEESLPQLLLRMVPLLPSDKTIVMEVLQRCVAEVFLMPLKLAAAHLGLTWAVFWVLGVELRYPALLLSVVFAVVPVLSPW
eukprot:RCo008455